MDCLIHLIHARMQMACPDLARGQSTGQEPAGEIPAAGKRWLCPEPGPAAAEPRLCSGAPIPSQKGISSTQVLNKCFWPLAAHLGHQLEGVGHEMALEIPQKC